MALGSLQQLRSSAGKEPESVFRFVGGYDTGEVQRNGRGEVFKEELPIFQLRNEPQNPSLLPALPDQALDCRQLKKQRGIAATPCPEERS